MAITAVRLLDVDHSLSGDNERSYALTYQVETTSKDDGPITVRTASAGGVSIPSLFDSFAYGSDSDSPCVCTAKRVALESRKDTYTLWRVTCTFTSTTVAWPVTSTLTSGSFPSSPVDYPAIWSGSYVQFTREYYSEYSGGTSIAIRNFAHEAYTNPPVTGDDSRPSIVVEKNFATADVGSWASYRDRVNDGVWWGFAAKTVKVQSINWQQLYYKNEPYVAARFEFHVNPDTWAASVLNAGYYERDAGGKRVQIKDKLGRPMSTPWPLHSSGRALTDAEVATSANFTFTDYDIYNTLDFATIGVPSVIGDP